MVFWIKVPQSNVLFNFICNNNNVRYLLFTVHWILDRSISYFVWSQCFPNFIFFFFIHFSFVFRSYSCYFYRNISHSKWFHCEIRGLYGQRTSENGKYLKWNVLGINGWILFALFRFHHSKSHRNENKWRKKKTDFRTHHQPYHQPSAIKQNRI